MSQSTGFTVELSLGDHGPLVNEVSKARYLLGKIPRSPNDITPRPRPSITLFSSNVIPTPEIHKTIAAFIEANSQGPIPISLSFDEHNYYNGDGQVFLLPTGPAVETLTQLRFKLFEALKSEGLEIGEADDHSWVPTCVLGEDVPQNQIDEVLSLWKENLDLSVTGHVMTIWLMELPPNPSWKSKSVFWFWLQAQGSNSYGLKYYQFKRRVRRGPYKRP